MLVTRLVLATVALGLVILGVGVVSGQDFPNKPIRIVVGGAGSGADFAARLIAQGLTANLGQQVIVDNRPSGIIPGETVSKAAPDGYTLLFIGNTLWLGPLLQKTPYDPVKDFSPIILAVIQPNLLVVHPSLPVKSVKELIALAKARPGKLNYGSLGAGSSNHLAAELFKSMAGVNIARIPYKGTGPAMTDLIAGEVQLMFSSAPAAMPQVKSGKLRALAVTTAEPSALVPGMPTVAASGLPGYAAAALLGLFAPAKTPAAIVNRMSQETVRVLNQADAKEKLFNAGIEVVGASAEKFATTISSEIARMGKVIKDAGIREE